MEDRHITTDSNIESSMHQTKHIDTDYFNEDFEESEEVSRKAILLQPYFSNNTLPSTLYLEQNVLHVIYEALSEVEKIRPKDPIEFFCAYILEKNKK